MFGLDISAWLKQCVLISSDILRGVTMNTVSLLRDRMFLENCMTDHPMEETEILRPPKLSPISTREYLWINTVEKVFLHKLNLIQNSINLRIVFGTRNFHWIIVNRNH